MAGLPPNWKDIGKRLTPPLTPMAIKKRLGGIVTRRNHIVHEGDYVRLERPRENRTNPLDEQEASDDIAFVADLITAIHVVLEP